MTRPSLERCRLISGEAGIRQRRCFRWMALAVAVTCTCIPSPRAHAEPEAIHEQAARSRDARFSLVRQVGEDLPVFPGASGFGTETAAGSGRHLNPPSSALIRVSTLAADGPGSLAACIATAAPRTCVFDVGGTIRLEQNLKVTDPYLTIAGQSAPEPGITLEGAGIVIATHDVLIQHLAIRPGGLSRGPKAVDRDAVTVGGSRAAPAHRVVLDHLSLSWGVDENVSTGAFAAHDVTISNCIIAEALRDSIHPKGHHSMGALIGDGTKRISIRRSLFAHNVERNPRLKSGVEAEVVENVIYGWGGRSSWNVVNPSDAAPSAGPVLLDLVGNVFIPGPSSPTVDVVHLSPAHPLTRIYLHSNIGPSRPQNSAPDWQIAPSIPALNRSRAPLTRQSQAAPLAPEELIELVLREVGARPAQRSATDRRIVGEVRARQGEFRDCTAGCARRACSDLDSSDCEPTPRATERRFEVPVHPHADTDGNGYTDLEDALEKAAVELVRAG